MVSEIFVGFLFFLKFAAAWGSRRQGEGVIVNLLCQKQRQFFSRYQKRQETIQIHKWGSGGVFFMVKCFYLKQDSKDANAIHSKNRA